MAFLEIKFFSDVLQMGTSMYVILPQKTQGNIGITEGETGDTYPTLYLLHGMSDDHTIWMRRTSIERYAEERGIAVVMPTTNLGWYTDMYNGFQYRTFIGKELPEICRRFFPFMSKKREDTYIAGNSMGGYGSVAIAFQYPETFSIAASLSGAFDPRWLNDPENTYFTDIFGPIESFENSPNDVFYLASSLLSEGKQCPKIYMWCGTEDFLYKDNIAFRDHLTKLGYDFIYSESPGTHSWPCWDREIQPILDYLISQYKNKEEK